MSKNTKRIILALIVLAILCGVYFWASSLNKNGKTPEKDKDNEPLTVQMLTDYKYNEVSYIEINVGGEQNIFERKESGEVLIREVELPLSATLTSAAYYSALHISYYKIVSDNLENKDQFGFNSPTANFTLYLANGKTDKYTVGMATPMNDGYYLIREGDNQIYMTDATLNNVAKASVKNCINKELSPHVKEVDTIRLKSPSYNNENIILKKTVFDKNSGSFAKYDYEIVQPDTGIMLNDYYMTEYVLKFLNGINATSVTELYPQDLSKYNFDRELEFTILDNSYKFMLNGKKADGTCDVVFNDLPIVYSVNYDSYFSGLDITLLDIQSKALLLENVADIKEISIKSDKTDVKFEISGTTSDENNPLVVKLNGKELDAYKFKKLYSDMLSIFIEGNIAQSDKIGRESLVITLTKRNTGEVITLKYYDIDARRKAVVLNDKKMEYYVYTKNLETFLTALDSFLQNS